MKRNTRLLAATVGALGFLAVTQAPTPASAAPVIYNFTPLAAGNTDLGQTEVYSASGGPNLSATAGTYGGTAPAGNNDTFAVSGPVHLVGNNRGAGEQGLGVCGTSSGNCNGSQLQGENGEIDYASREAVQLNIAPLFALFTNFTINADSATEGEQLAIYQSSSATNIGTFLMQINDASGNVVVAPTQNYLYFISNTNLGGGNVLLHSFTVTPDVDINPLAVPEPATLAVLGMGLLGLGAVKRRRV